MTGLFGADAPSGSGKVDPTGVIMRGMRVAFVVIISFFSVLSALSLWKTVTVVPDVSMVIRWLCAALASAFIAIFWEATRRRYVTRGSLRANPALAVLAACALTVLIFTMIVFAVTD